MTDKHFEDFHQENTGGDLFDRAAALDTYLAESPEQMLEGLGLVSLDAAQPEMRLHDGETDRRTIMLGSNSYLNLTTHPDVRARLPSRRRTSMVTGRGPFHFTPASRTSIATGGENRTILRRRRRNSLSFRLRRERRYPVGPLPAGGCHHQRFGESCVDL